MNESSRVQTKESAPLARDLKVETIPAYISTLTMDIGQGRRLQLQTPFAHDENVQDALGRVLAAADFHRARYEIEEVEEELHKMELQHKDFENHFERVSDNHDLDALRAEGETYVQQHVGSGRRGDVKLPQAFQQRKDAAERTHAANLKQGKFQLLKSQIQMDHLKREIEKRRKLVEGG